MPRSGRRLSVTLWLSFWVAASVSAQTDLPLGLGIAQPTDVSSFAPLRFFGSPDASAALDSVTFRSGPHHFEIAAAPPWLDPETVMLDYDVIQFRIVSLRREWAEVLVHTQEIRWPPQTMWLRRDGIEVRPWTTFLLDVSSIETPEATPYFSGPSDDSGVLGNTEPGLPLHVLQVTNAWAKVAIADAPETDQGALGWIRWHDGERLIVAYSLIW